MPSGTVHLAQMYIDIDGSPLNRDTYMSRLSSVEVDDSIYLPDMFTLTLSDPSLEALQADVFKLGSEVKISIKVPAPDQGGSPSGQVELMTGEITAIEPVLDPEQGTTLTIHGYDRSHKLHRIRKTETYLNVSDSDVVSRLAREGGLQARVTSTSPVYPYLMQANQTNWEFMQERAQRIGYRLYVEQRTVYFEPPPASPEVLPLRWGEEMAHFIARLTTADQISEVTVRGWDPKAKSAIVGRKSSASSGVPIRRDNGSSGGQRSNIAHGISGKQVVVDHPVYNQTEADKVAQAVLDQRSSGFVEAEALAGGNPQLKAGVAVNVSGIGSRFGGKYLVTRALHRYTAKEYTTRLWASSNSGSLMQLLGGGHAPHSTNGAGKGGFKPTETGIMVGLVTNLQDPDNMGRVKVKFPALGDNIESFWCRLVTPMAGNTRGIAFSPEVNDEVAVMFQNGDPNHGYVLGGVWNGSDGLPKPTGQLVSGGQVVRRVIRSRVGHEIIIIDAPITPEGITIIDKTQNNYIKINTTENKTEIQCQGDITVKSATGNITVKADAAKVTVQATQDIDLKSDAGKVKITGTAGVDINSPAIINIKGSMLNLN